MKSYKYFCYPMLRRSYGTLEELGRVINRGTAAMQKRMNGKIEFTNREKELILKDLGEEITAENKRKYFSDWRRRRVAA